MRCILTFVVLAVILFGITTATESAAIGVIRDVRRHLHGLGAPVRDRDVREPT